MEKRKFVTPKIKEIHMDLLHLIAYSDDFGSGTVNPFATKKRNNGEEDEEEEESFWSH